MLPIAHAEVEVKTTVPQTTPYELFHAFSPTNGKNDPNSKIGIVANIDKYTSSDWQVVITKIIQFILSITGTIAFISFTYAGILMLTAQGKEEQITKGKTIILWSILALLIIAVSYALVSGISQLNLNGSP